MYLRGKNFVLLLSYEQDGEDAAKRSSEVDMRLTSGIPVLLRWLSCYRIPPSTTWTPARSVRK